jgi:hypothetical protein
LVERNAEEDKTVPMQITALWGGRKVELRETPRAVTPFGGLVVFFEFLRQVGYVEVVKQCLPFRLTSPNALDPAQSFTAFLLAVLAGARRFAHASVLRADTALHQALGMVRFPSDDTLRNLFKRFGQGSASDFFLACGLGSWHGFRNVLRDTVWIWTPRSWNATASNRVRCAGPIRASMVGPRTIRCWRC